MKKHQKSPEEIGVSLDMPDASRKGVWKRAAVLCMMAQTVQLARLPRALLDRV